MSFTENNHYVPQWHQRLFISPHEKEPVLYYRDLQPFTKGGDGKLHPTNELYRKGPGGCFAEKNLYTLAFGTEKSDVVEKRFFGEVDERGADALPKLAEYEFGKHGMDCVKHFAHYMNAQKMRTPKGLDFIKTLSLDGTHTGALLLLPQLSQTHITIWSEGIWEIFRCDNTETKFILSDHPVAAYNKGAFPDSSHCKYPLDVGIDLLGTRTIFPLTPARCLVISNLGYVRNPHVPPLQQRINPRVMGDTVMFAGNIHTGRQLREDQVLAINYILKKRARRYIAAGQEEWLYPEHGLKRLTWDKLGGQFFLEPDPRRVRFTSATFVRYKGGDSMGWDEYGQHPNDDDPERKAHRAHEQKTFYEAQDRWEKHFGPLKRKPTDFPF